MIKTWLLYKYTFDQFAPYTCTLVRIFYILLIIVCEERVDSRFHYDFQTCSNFNVSFKIQTFKRFVSPKDAEKFDLGLH